MNHWLALLELGTTLDPLFAWRAGARGAEHEQSPVSVLVGTSASGQQALDTLLHYFPCVTNAYHWESRQQPDGAALVTIHCARPELTPAVAYDLANTVSEAARLTHTSGLIELFWSGPALRPPGVYRSILGVEPTFDAPHTGLLIPAALLAAPMPTARPGVSRFVKPELEALRAACLGTQTVTQRVNQYLRASPGPAAVTAAEVAEHLGIGRRTLERKLAAEGSGFIALRDARCRDLALRELPTTPIKAIAFELGYASVRAFNRAFERWTGTSPARYRDEPR